MTVCENCGTGTYASATGATKCLTCDLNTYADAAGLSLCKQCELCSTVGAYRAFCGPVSAGYCAACTNPAVL
jgi:hypothetical protein